MSLGRPVDPPLVGALATAATASGRSAPSFPAAAILSTEVTGTPSAAGRSPTTTLGLPSATMAASSRSEEHTSELQSLMRISYAVFCLKTKKPITLSDTPYYNHRYTRHTHNSK